MDQIGSRAGCLLARDENELTGTRLDDAAAKRGRFHFSALHQRRRSGGRPERPSARADIASPNLPCRATAILVEPVTLVNRVGWKGMTVFGFTSRTSSISCKVTACRPPRRDG